VEVVTDLFPNGAHRLDEQAGPVLERAAVLVLAVVDRRGEELREEVPVRPVDLDPVETCLARPSGARGESPDDLA
jgi:hypothetical protein